MKTSKLLYFVILLFIFFSCQTNNSDITIGLLIPASEGYRWPTDKHYIEQAAGEKDIKVITLSAENDENLQLRQAEELLNEGVDVLIVVAANANTAGAIVRNAERYNVPVVAYDRLLQNCDLNYFISFDEKSIAGLMMEYALKKVPKGNYVLLWGESSDPNARAIKEEQERILSTAANREDINIFYRAYVENWSRENASHLMEKIITFGGTRIDAVITSYDGLALGVIDAYEALGIDTFPLIIGQDAELEALHNIIDGKMSLTIYKSIKTIAHASVELAINLAANKRYEMENTAFRHNGRKNVPSVMLTPIAVDINSINDIVIADGFYTEEQVYGE